MVMIIIFRVYIQREQTLKLENRIEDLKIELREAGRKQKIDVKQELVDSFNAAMVDFTTYIDRRLQSMQDTKVLVTFCTFK